MTAERYKRYDHAPAHLFRPGTTYMVTAGTYGGVAQMQRPERRAQVAGALRKLLSREGWALLAWVVLPNHYHVLVGAPDARADTLATWVADLHKYTARHWNDEDGTPGRKVWWNYWDTCITSQRSFWARVNYVHWNPVKHGLAAKPEDYAFSSYAELAACQDLDVEMIERKYPFDRVRAQDDF